MDRGVFISYRRDTGSTMARMLYDRMRLEKGYDCFLDVEKLSAGNFRENIAAEMDKCDIFLLVLSKNALKRCVSPDDTVRREIEYALERGLAVIPVTAEDFVWPERMPEGLESIGELNAIPYVQVYSEQFFERLYSFIETIRGEGRAKERERGTATPSKKAGGPRAIAGAAVLVLLLAVILFLWKNREAPPKEDPAPSPAPAAPSAAPQETEGPASAPEAEEDRLLPESFLRDLEALAAKRLSGLLTEHAVLSFGRNDGSSFDVDARRIKLGDMELQKEALFFETGGTAALYLVYKGEVSIQEDWAGDCPDGVIVFKLDAFPNKFFSVRGDGTISCRDGDLDVYRLFESEDEYKRTVHGEYQYTDHEVYEIVLP